MKHTCFRCGKDFPRPSHLKRHLNKKKFCININSQNINTNIHSVFTDIHKMYANNKHIIGSNTIIISCDYCKKAFTTNSNKIRHIRLYCKKKKEKEELKQLYEIVETLKNKVMELENKPNSVTINNNSNNNTNTINNIQLNNYGKENTDYLKNTAYIKKITMKPNLLGLLDYLNRKYCDPDHCENWNIGITNLKHDTCKIYKNNEWETKSANAVISEGFMRGSLEVNDIMENLAYESGRKSDENGDILNRQEQKFVDAYDKATCSDVMDDFYVIKLKEMVEEHKKIIYDHTMRYKAYFMKMWGKSRI